MKEPLRVSHPTPGIAKANLDHDTFTPRAHGQFLPLLVLHGALAILSQVEEHLHQALAVGPNRRQIVLNFPPARDAAIAQGRLNHNAQLVEQGLNLHARGLARILPEVHCGNAFERHNQRTQGFKVFILC
jgi:hypothetical protein